MTPRVENPGLELRQVKFCPPEEHQEGRLEGSLMLAAATILHHLLRGHREIEAITPVWEGD